MQNLENLDVFEILIIQKLLKSPKDPFVRSVLICKSYHSDINYIRCKITDCLNIEYCDRNKALRIFQLPLLRLISFYYIHYK